MPQQLPPPKPPPGAAQQRTPAAPTPNGKLPPARPPPGAAQSAQGVQGRIFSQPEGTASHSVSAPAPTEPPMERAEEHNVEPAAAPPVTLLPRTAQLLRSVHEELTMGTLDLAGHPSGRHLRSLIDHVDSLLHFPEAAPPKAAPAEDVSPEATPPQAAPTEDVSPEATPPEAAPPKAALPKK